MDTPTALEIAAHYQACLDSVALINGGKPAGMSEDDWTETLARNRSHLAIMLARPFWTDEDLSAIEAAANG